MATTFRWGSRATLRDRPEESYLEQRSATGLQIRRGHGGCAIVDNLGRTRRLRGRLCRGPLRTPARNFVNGVLHHPRSRACRGHRRCHGSGARDVFMQRDLSCSGLCRYVRHHGERGRLQYCASIRSSARQQSVVWLCDDGHRKGDDRAQPITAVRARTNRGPRHLTCAEAAERAIVGARCARTLMWSARCLA